MSRVIYALDVGSPLRGLAWARLAEGAAEAPTGAADLELAVERIVADLRSGSAIAIGFEAPGFIPVPATVVELAKARTGEVRGATARPWCASAGAYVATMLLQIGGWLLRELHERYEDAATTTLTLSPDAWPNPARILLWEAFVSGAGHARTANASAMSEHIQDAATAALAFRAWEASNPRPASAVTAAPCFSSLGALGLWAGWTNDLAVLSQEALVLWPDQPLGIDVIADVPALRPQIHVEQASTAVAMPADVSILSIRCGASHSFWKQHQAAGQATHFDALADLVSSAPERVRKCDVSFDAGQTWLRLELSWNSASQLSWRGFNARAKATDMRMVLVRV